MKIRSIIHKGLERLYTTDNAKGVPSASVDKLQKMLAFLDSMTSIEELQALRSWRPHMLTGDRKGMVSLSVTGNRRSTFRVDVAKGEIYDLNLEDYH